MMEKQELAEAIEQIQYHLNRITISNYTTALGRDRGLEERQLANKIIDDLLSKIREK